MVRIIAFALALFTAVQSLDAQAVWAFSEAQSKSLVIVEHAGGSVSIRAVGGARTQDEAQPPLLGTGGLPPGGAYQDGNSAMSAVQGSLSLGNYPSAVAQYLTKGGYSTANIHWYYTFNNQDVGVNQQVYGCFSVKSDGTMTNLGWQVVNANGGATVMHYRYISLAAETGLPSGPGWTHDKGGSLTKQVEDAFGAPQGPEVDITPSPLGLYDPPGTSYSGNAVDPDAGLKQLISQVVVSGIQGNGAAFAKVDYVRQIVPVYDCDSSGVCTARRAVDFQSRTLALTDPCNPGSGATYECSGVWGFELRYTTSHYIVDPQGNYSLTGEDQTPTPSPAVQFDVMAPVSEVTPASLQYVVVDPYGTGQVYDIRNDAVNNLSCACYIDRGVSCNAAAISQAQQQCVPQQSDGGGGGG